MLYCSTQIFAQVIPDNRRIVWEPGVPGGIPTIESNIISVLDYGADNTGQDNSSSAVDQAINALPPEGGDS